MKTGSEGTHGFVRRGWSCDQKIVRGSCYSQSLGLGVSLDYLQDIFRLWLGYKRKNRKWIGHLLNTTNHLLITFGTEDATTHGQQQHMHIDITWKLYYILGFSIKPFIECALLITKWDTKKLLLSFRSRSIKENCWIISSISWKTSRKFFTCYLSTNKNLSLMTCHERTYLKKTSLINMNVLHCKYILYAFCHKRQDENLPDYNCIQLLILKRNSFLDNKSRPEMVLHVNNFWIIANLGCISCLCSL